MPVSISIIDRVCDSLTQNIDIIDNSNFAFRFSSLEVIGFNSNSITVTNEAHLKYTKEKTAWLKKLNAYSTITIISAVQDKNTCVTTIIDLDKFSYDFLDAHVIEVGANYIIVKEEAFYVYLDNRRTYNKQFEDKDIKYKWKDHKPDLTIEVLTEFNTKYTFKRKDIVNSDSAGLRVKAEAYNKFKQYLEDLPDLIKSKEYLVLDKTYILKSTINAFKEIKSEGKDYMDIYIKDRKDPFRFQLNVEELSILLSNTLQSRSLFYED